MIDQSTAIFIGILFFAGLITSFVAHKKYALTRHRAYLAVMALDRCQFLLERIKALEASGCDSILLQGFNAYMVTHLAKVFALNPNHQEAKDIAIKALATAENHTEPTIKKMADRDSLKKAKRHLNRAFTELPSLVQLKIIPKTKLNYWRAHIKEQTAEMELTFHFAEAQVALKEQRVGPALNHLSRCETILKKTRFREPTHTQGWITKILDTKKPLLLH